MKPEPHKQISEIHLHIAENRASIEKYYPDRIIRFKSYNLQSYAFQKSSHLDYSPQIAIFVLSCKKIRRWYRRNGQADTRPCKKTVGDAGIGTEKASQITDIH